MDPPVTRRTSRRGSTVRRRMQQVAARGEETAGGGEADVGHGVRRLDRQDHLATEEPLEIRIVAPAGTGSPGVHRISVTMRTPGADFELAAGFLFGEALIDRREQIVSIGYCSAPYPEYNVVNVVLAPDTPFDPDALQRNFYTTSSCGVCGMSSIDAVMRPSRVRSTGERRGNGDGAGQAERKTEVSARTLLELPRTLRAAQAVFERTGGLHAAALFSTRGELLEVREDVGRHNAMDKLIGGAFLGGKLPLSDGVVLVSGRLSFELVQKVARAGVPVVCAVSAPSSLAVELADEAGITLVGFLREGRFNIYSGSERVLTDGTG